MTSLSSSHYSEFLCINLNICVCQKHCKGLELFIKVCDHLNLLEKDYYGLAIWETPVKKVSC